MVQLTSKAESIHALKLGICFTGASVAIHMSQGQTVRECSFMVPEVCFSL